MSVVSGVCPFCGKLATLINSHVVPSYLLNRPPEGKESDGLLNVRKDARRTGFVPDAMYARLLCRPCDLWIEQEYETPFRKHWFDDGKCPSATGGKGPAGGAGDYVLVTGLDYSTVKLFVLSVLWRASVARYEMFNETRLGNKHEKRLLRLLRTREPGPEGMYPITGRLIVAGDAVNHGVVVPPGRCHPPVSGVRLYSMAFAGVEWIVGVSSFESTESSGARLTFGGTILLPRISQEDIIGYSELMSRQQSNQDRTSRKSAPLRHKG